MEVSPLRRTLCLEMYLYAENTNARYPPVMSAIGCRHTPPARQHSHLASSEQKQQRAATHLPLIVFPNESWHDARAHTRKQASSGCTSPTETTAPELGAMAASMRHSRTDTRSVHIPSLEVEGNGRKSKRGRLEQWTGAGNFACDQIITTASIKGTQPPRGCQLLRGATTTRVTLHG